MLADKPKTTGVRLLAPAPALALVGRHGGLEALQTLAAGSFLCLPDDMYNSGKIFI